MGVFNFGVWFEEVGGGGFNVVCVFVLLGYDVMMVSVVGGDLGVVFVEVVVV